MKFQAAYLVGAMLSSVLVSGVAKAADFSFTFTSAIISGSGTVSSGADNTDPFTIASASGLIVLLGSKFTITGPAPTFYFPDLQYTGTPSNNLSFLNTTYVDPLASGLAFRTDNGGDFLLYASDTATTGYRVRSSRSGDLRQTVNVSFTRTDTIAVPGPLAGAGLVPLFALAGAWFARRRHLKPAA